MSSRARGARQEVQMRRRLAISRNKLNVLLAIETPWPGKKVWLPLSQCDFGQSENASAEYDHQVVRIPAWLYRRMFEEDLREPPESVYSNEVPF